MFLVLENLKKILNIDSGFNGQFGFQDPASPIMEGIIDLHHHIAFFLILVFVFVFYLIGRTLYLFYYQIRSSKNKQELLNEIIPLYRLNHGTTIEIIWTIIPSVILILIAIPSFTILYASDECLDANLTVKAIASQWYWTYEMNDYDLPFLRFDSYMLPDDELVEGSLRLLEVDNPLVLPIHMNIRLLITATDVLHAFAVPSLGIKLDAVPGRLNQVPLYIKRPGIFHGQCSEICGVQHGFMPIVIKGVHVFNFVYWYALQWSIDNDFLPEEE